MEFQTTECFCIAAHSALEERAWKRICCLKTKDCDATETRGSQLNGELFAMANTNPHKSEEECVQAKEFQKIESFYVVARSALEERTCCLKNKDCDATSAPVMLPETRGSQLNGELLAMAKTNPHESEEESVQAMEFQKIESFYVVARSALDEWTWKRTCCLKPKDCDATY
jgi:hypothetical protein